MRFHAFFPYCLMVANQAFSLSPFLVQNFTMSNNLLFEGHDIARYMWEGGHRSWGLVIYRCTYQSDEDWNIFMNKLRSNTKTMLGYGNGLELMNSLEMTIFDDRENLENASTTEVRRRFNDWAIDAPTENRALDPAWRIVIGTTYSSIKAASIPSSTITDQGKQRTMHISISS